MPELSVIFVNYNGGTMIIDAIRSVVATVSGIAYEIIVADNASSDGSPEIIKNTFGERVFMVEMGRNAGFAAANNAGLKKATGDYILFLNPDTIVLDGALQTMIEYLNTHPDVGACGGNLYSQDLQPQFSYWTLLPGVRMEWSGLFSDVFLRCKHKGSHEHNFTGQPKDVAYIMGADLMVRRELIERVGKMDEDFFLFYEETELCYRIRRAGYRIVNVPDAHIIHLEGKTIDSMGIRHEQMMQSRAIYLSKCSSRMEHWMANAVLALSSALRVIAFALAGNKEKVRYWKFTLQHIRP